MKKRIAVMTLGLAGIAAAAVVLPKPPQLERPGGALWSGYSRLEIPAAGVKLTQGTLIQVDELVLKGPLITQGHRLQVETKRLVFADGGKITAFNGIPAPAITAVPTSKASSMAHAGGQGGEGQKGGPGATGEAGTTGVDGNAGEANPEEIAVFAAQVVGTPIIDGKGQTGGKGGKGGQGQKGGPGGKGGNAYATCAPWNVSRNKDGGPGGDGGEGGLGGRGGKGGRGGRPAKVTLLVGYAPEGSAHFDGVTTGGGDPGPGGDGGEMGPGGDGGPGGDPDEATVHAIVYECEVKQNGGRPGNRNTVTGKTLGAGPEGDSAPLFENGDALTIKPLNELELARYRVSLGWYGFHFARTLSVLLVDSIRALRNDAWTREQLLRDGVNRDMLVAADRDAARRVAQSWKDQMLSPLWATDPDVIDGSADLQTLLETSRKMVDVFTDISQGRLTDLTVATLNDLRESSVAQAALKLRSGLRGCAEYLRKHDELLPALFGKTSHFDIPVCTRPDGEAYATRLDEPIVLSEPVPPRVDGADLPIVPQSPAPLVAEHAVQPPRVYSLFENLLGMSEARADDFRVIIIDNRPFSVAMVRDSAPLLGRGVEPNGILEAYVAPSAGDVTSASLGYYLRTLAIQAGARQ